MQRLCIFIVSIFFATNIFAAKPQPQTLRLNVQKGQKFTHDVDMNMTIAAKAFGFDVNINAPLFLTLNYEVVSNDFSDTTAIKIELDKLKTHFEFMGEGFSFDSELPSNDDNKASGLLKGILHKPFEIHYNKYRKITNIVGLDSALNKNVKSNRKDFDLIQMQETQYQLPPKSDSIKIADALATDTLDKSIKPMYYVDGIPCDTLNIQFSDVMHVTVLNNETAIALYGEERGKNGLILFDTKDFNKTQARIKAQHQEKTINLDSIINANSENLGQNPLYVVDGVICNDISTVDVYDIGTAAVLKKSTAIQIYGEKGEDGAVLITLKSATRNDKNNLFSVNKVNNNLPTLNNEQKEKIYEILSTIIFPETPIKTGSKWNRSILMTEQEEKLEIKTNYKIKEINEKNTVISCNSKYNFGFDIKDIKFKTCTSTGEMVFDNNTGWLISSNSVQTLIVQFKINGKAVSIKLSINSKIVSK